MKIQKDSVVAIDYVLKNDAGDVIDKSEAGAPLHYLHGYGNIVPGLEAALTGRGSGESLDVILTPEEGYGPRREELIMEVPKSQLPADIVPRKGERLRFNGSRGPMVAMIQKVKVNTIVLDANPELAGETLHFSVTIGSVRKASKSELEHGHAHGPGGHHH